MKAFKLILLLFLGGLLSCSSDDDPEETTNELDDLQLFTEFSNATHTVELYSETGTLQTGYNEISLRIRDAANGEFLSDADVSWTPVIQLIGGEYSAPASEITKVQDSQNLYKGTVIFTMPTNSEAKWELNINYSNAQTDGTVSGWLEIPAAEETNSISFRGSDGKHYTLALVEPTHPEVAVNDIVIGLFEMKSMGYDTVDNYTIKIDPRMPGMGNHSSPNNVDLVQGEDGFYHGKLSLTMTGLWQINLQVQNASGETIQGEAVTETNPASSIYLELKF